MEQGVAGRNFVSPDRKVHVPNRSTAQRVVDLALGARGRIWLDRELPDGARGVQVGVERGSTKEVLAFGETLDDAVESLVASWLSIPGSTFASSLEKFRAVERRGGWVAPEFERESLSRAFPSEWKAHLDSLAARAGAAA